MLNKKRRLGRGLETLLGEIKSVMPEEKIDLPVDSDLKEISLDCIQPGKYQPRKNFSTEALSELTESIRTQGVIQPILVRHIDQQNFEIIAGERRFRAAKNAGLEKIPALVREVSDETAVAVALIENIQRENLNPLEEALALQRLIEEFNLTHQDVAKAVGKSRTAVTNLLRLLSLEETIKELLEAGALEMGHARALLILEPELQCQAGKLIVEKQLSVRETEQLVKELHNPTVKNTSTLRYVTMGELEKKLNSHIKMPVQIKQTAQGKGKLTVHYKNHQELEKILDFFDL